MLTKTADALESREHPEHDGDRIALIRALHNAWMDLDHSNAGMRLNLRRDRIMQHCRLASDAYAKRLHLLDVPTGVETVEDHPMPFEWRLERAADMAVMLIAMDLPDLESKLRANVDKLKAYVRALLENTGGTGNYASQNADDAIEALWEALGLGAVRADSVRTAIRRVRKDT